MARLQTRLLSLTQTQRYGIAIVGVILATLLRLALDPLLGPNLPLFLFVFPIIVVAWYGGLGPGLLATALSLVVGDYLFIPPRGSLFLNGDPLSVQRILSLLATGTVFSILCGKARKAIKSEFESLQRAEEKTRFVLQLNQALAALAGPEELLSTAMRMLGEYLRADCAGYSDVDGDHFVVLEEYHREPTRRIAGRYCISDFGEKERQTLREGRPYVVNDIENESSERTDLSLYRSLGIRSVVTVPLTKGRKLVARVAVHQNTPRHWQNHEVDFIGSVAHRCWESVERARAVKSMKDSDDRYRAFMANSSEGIWRYELDQPISVTLPEEEQVELYYQHAYLAECNEAFARMHGSSSLDQIVGQRLTVLLVRSDADKVIEYTREFVRSGYRLIGAETREVDVYGNTGYFVSNLVGIVENETLVRAWGTQRDITDQKRAETALRESEERFAKAFRASPDALIITRMADGVILEVNDSFVALSGYDRDELIGKSTVRIGLYVDPTVRARLVETVEEKGRVRDIKFALKRKSGEARLISFSAEPLDLRGEHCWVTICRDITEQEKAENERELLLRKEKVAREEAEVANRTKDQFLATISHELRTPLTSILGWARMLIRGSLSPSQTRHALEVIEHSAELQARLVNDILDVSRIITGRFHLEATPVEIAGVLEAAVEVIRPSAEAKRIALNVMVEARDGTVLGDASRLQQIIWNLLSNAVKFTGEGGGIDVQLRRIGERVEICISDTGIGIKPQFLPHVFDRFRQADSTSTRRYGGLGLGLAIVRHLVELHGGSVSAWSAGEGKGSTFTLSFPITRTSSIPRREIRPLPAETRGPSEAGPAPVSQNLDGVRVLVVEDDPETLDLLKCVLEGRQAEVTTASSATEALRVLEHSLPDVLLSDLAMPDQDGYDLIRQLRSRPPERGGTIPAIALSAYTRPEDRARSIAAGFQLHVSKPVDPGDLISALAIMTGTEKAPPTPQPDENAA
jgi:PAS domain S-box-containing protein